MIDHLASLTKFELSDIIDSLDEKIISCDCAADASPEEISYSTKMVEELTAELNTVRAYRAAKFPTKFGLSV